MRGDKSVDDVGSTKGVWFGRPINDAFDHRTVAEIQGKATKHSGRGRVSRLLHSKNDKEKIAGWKLELDKILQVFNVRRVSLVRPQLTAPLSDGVGRKHPCEGFWDSRQCVEDSGGGWQ